MLTLDLEKVQVQVGWSPHCYNSSITNLYNFSIQVGDFNVRCVFRKPNISFKINKTAKLQKRNPTFPNKMSMKISDMLCSGYGKG